MPSLPERKAGIVACSGEELAVGTVTRLAALKVLHELRPGRTVTICLPLFLAGGEGDRAFARCHPTITVDGCALRCAARGTARYSGAPAASLVVDELVAESGLPRPDGRRRLDQAGQAAVELTAERLAATVDEVLRAGKAQRDPSVEPVAARPGDAAGAACACGSRVPATRLRIGGIEIDLLALPLICREFLEAGRCADDPTVARDLLEAVRVYNHIPEGADDPYRDALVREYAAFCAQEAAR